MESSTSNNQWSGRVLRIGTFVVLVVIFLAVGRFTTYKFMLSEDGVDCPRITSVEKIVDTDASELDYILFGSDRPDDPISIALYDGRTAVDYELELRDEVYNGTVTWSKPDCGWLDDFGASIGYFVVGHLAGLFAMALAAFFAVASVLTLMGIAAFAVFLWNGRPESSDEEPEGPNECSDPGCRCGYHQVAVFDQERQEWFVHCRDMSCGCILHADETFDETRNEWV